MTRLRSAALAVILLNGAALIAQSDQVHVHDPDWVAPAAEGARANPLANDESIVAGGRKVFGQRCASCHGDDGRGSKRAPSLAADEVRAQLDGELFWKISSGNARAGMPSFSFLPAAQRWQLVMHLRHLDRTP